MRKKLSFLFLLFFLLLFSFLFACYYETPSEVDFEEYKLDLGKNWQEYEVPRRNLGFNNIYQTFVSSDGSKLFVRNSNDIYRSYDNGNSWVLLNENEFYNTCWSENGQIIYSFVKDNFNNLILKKSSDYGNSFTTITNYGNDYSASSCFISCSADGQILLTSFNKKIYKSNNGQDLVLINNLPEAEYTFVSVSSDGVTLIAAVYDGPIYISHDSGNNWTSLDNLGNRKWMGVCFSSDSSKIFLLAKNSYILFSNDSGNTFNNLINSTPTCWSSIDCSSSGQVVYAVDYEGYLYKSTDYGNSWNTINIIGKRKFSSVNCSNDASKILVGISEKINSVIYSPDSFNSIYYLNSPDYYSTKEKYNYSAVSEDGSFSIFLSSIYTIMKSVDYGKNWIDCSNSAFNNITHFAASKNCNVLALVNDGYLYLSKDKSESWNKVNSIPKNTICTLAISDDGNTILLSTPNIIYISRNSGNTWATVTNIQDLFIHSAVSAFGDVIALSSKNKVYIATNKTNNFKTYQKKYQCDFTDFCFTEDGRVIVYYDCFGLSYSVDFGVTWSSTEFELFCGYLSKDGELFICAEPYYSGGFLVDPAGYIHKFFNNLTSHSTITKYGIFNTDKVVIANDKSVIFFLGHYKLYVSTDEGNSWSCINVPASLISNQILNFIITPDKSKLIITTNSSYLISQTIK